MERNVNDSSVSRPVIKGYLTGVFDLFHIGHLNIIKNARDRCDYLIVGVTTDELCTTEKGKEPIIGFEERIQIISSLRYVDQVVPQSSYDKMQAWKAYSFHRIFVGDDWKGSERWNKLEQQFQSVGVDIVYFPYTKSTSSTKIRRIINSFNFDAEVENKIN